MLLIEEESLTPAVLLMCIVLLLSLNKGDILLRDEKTVMLTLLLISFDSLLLSEDITIVLLDMRDTVPVGIALLIVPVLAFSIFLILLSTCCLTASSNVALFRTVGVFMLVTVRLLFFR